MSHADAILADLKAGFCIDPMTALQKYGCARLAARVKDLRDAGYRIVTNRTTVRTRSGTARIAVYRMAND